MRGHMAELAVAAELAKQEYLISLPTNHGQHYDLIIDNGNKLFKIQVKRAFYHHSSRSKEYLSIESRRLPTSRNLEGKVKAKQYEKDSFDFLVACDVDKNDFWIIPIEDVLKYKASIYLETKKGIVFKDKWDLIK